MMMLTDRRAGLRLRLAFCIGLVEIIRIPASFRLPLSLMHFLELLNHERKRLGHRPAQDPAAQRFFGLTEFAAPHDETFISAARARNLCPASSAPTGT